MALLSLLSQTNPMSDDFQPSPFHVRGEGNEPQPQPHQQNPSSASAPGPSPAMAMGMGMGMGTGMGTGVDPQHPPPHPGSHPQQIDPRQNDMIAAELRRMQQARTDENNALMQLLRRQEMAAYAGPTGASSQQPFHGMSAGDASALMPPSMMGGGMGPGAGGQMMMGNRGMGGMEGAGAMGAQLNNFFASGMMGMAGMAGGMNPMPMPSAPAAMASSSPAAAALSSPAGAHLDPFAPSSSSSFPSGLGGDNDFPPSSGASQGASYPPAAGVAGAAATARQGQGQGQSNKEDPGWEEQFRSLQAFTLRNGHCKVPARYKANPKLGRWVMTQRRQFTLLMQGFPSALSAERIRRLEGLGFTWSVRPEPVTMWNKKFQELLAYKATYGNCMVPQRYQANPQLGTWVHTQRRQNKLMAEGKSSSMTKEKVEALDGIGFFWAAKNSTSSTADKILSEGDKGDGGGDKSSKDSSGKDASDCGGGDSCKGPGAKAA
ncbi:hypothetical protein ACHAWF_019027 [Thalassiosira exigua]